MEVYAGIVLFGVRQATDHSMTAENTQCSFRLLLLGDGVEVCSRQHCLDLQEAYRF